MFASAPSSTFTSIMSTSFLCGSLTRSFVRIFVLPSGSVSVWYCFYWSGPGNAMKGSQNVNIINIIPVNLDAVGVPSLQTDSLIMTWTWSVCLCQICDISWAFYRMMVFYLSVGLNHCPLLHDDLQHELKWFLKPHLWHFLPNAGQSLNWCVVLHLLHVLLSRVLWPLVLCEPLVLVLFLLFRLKVMMASTVVGWVIPPFDLWWLKSFTVISCSFAYWSSAWYVTSSHHFFDLTHFFTSKCLVAWNKSSVLHTHFLLFWVLASLHEVLDLLIKLVSWLVLALFDVAVYLVDVVPVWCWDFEGVRDGFEDILRILLSLLVSGYGQCVPPFETFLTEISNDGRKPDVSVDAGCA